MTNEELKLMLIVGITNCIMMGCFTALAIIFDKWWLILFSVLFWRNITYKAKGKED